MIKAVKKIYLFMAPVWIACAFGSGFLLCLLLRGLLTKSGWAEAISAIATVIALALAVVTYKNWQQQKIREDAYSTKRLYVATLVLIEATTIELINLLYNIIPEAGMLVPSDAQAKNTLEKVIDKHNDLRLHAQTLMTTRSELNFWGASLSIESEKEYNSLIESINSYLQSLHFLHNSLLNFYIHKISDHSMEQWKLRVANENINLHELFKKRKAKSMSSLFKL